jgi:hypothetical protein
MADRHLIADSAPPDPKNLPRAVSARIIHSGRCPLTARGLARPHNG